MHILRRAVMRAAEQPDEPTVTAAHLASGAERRAKDYLDRLTLERERLLATASIEKQRPGGDESDRLLHDNLILYYDNGDPWCQPHPLVMPRLRTRFGADFGSLPEAQRS